jgi:tetratricopeptide (TPR) repeat protein
MNNDWITKLSDYVATGEGIAWVVGLVAVPSAVWAASYARKQLAEYRRLQERRIDPLTPPIGFSPIEREPTGTLRDYLGSKMQPYYGWSLHQKNVPFSESGFFADEHELLNTFLKSTKPLLLTGEGGCGKTRFALELCRMARSKKSSDEQWQAIAINRSIREEDLQILVQRLQETKARLILMLDYVETLESALSFDRIHDLVTANPEHLRLVATCRRTYYENIQTRPTRFIDGYSLVLNLNESPNSVYGRWLAGWRDAVCQEINSVAEKVKIPALAVILRYLKEKKMNPGAWQLGKEDEWVYGILAHSVRMHAPDLSPTSEELAHLLVLFRMSHTVWCSIAAKESRSEKILNAWKRDGWITSVSGRKEGMDQDGHELGHDLLCDLSLLWHLKQSPNLLKDRLDTLWNYASEHGGERSCFITLKSNLPTFALHFNIAQLLDPTRNSERTGPIHPEEPERAAKVQSMVLTSLSLNIEEKKRVFDATYKLSHFKLTELEKSFEDENHKINELTYELSDASISIITKLIIKNVPNNPMLWFFMNAGGYYKETIPALQKQLQKCFSVPKLSAFMALVDNIMKDMEFKNFMILVDELFSFSEKSEFNKYFIASAAVLVNKGHILRMQGKTDEAIALYNMIDKQYSAIVDVELQKQCAKALLDKGVLFEAQGKNDDAIAVYELINERYGNLDQVELQEQCAKALVNKGGTLVMLGKHKEAIAVYHLIEERYGSVDRPEIREQCLIAVTNSVEVYLLTGKSDTAIQRAQKAEILLDADSTELPIMHFYRWLAGDSDVAVEGIVEAIEQTPESEEFAWRFDETKPYYQRLDEKRKAIAEAFTAFFVNEINRLQLKERLGLS